ncbi:MAG: HAD family hydrolase [Candidatus Woesearchaeota archaeon]
MKRDIDAVVFDLYGTLVHVTDERRPYRRLFRRLALPLFFNSLGRKEIRNICLTEELLSLSAVVERLLPYKKDLDLRKYDAELAREVGSVELYPDTLSTLEMLKSRGVKLGMISNLASPYKEPFFRLGLDRYISDPVFSCDVGMIKPEKDIYRLALDRLGVSAERALMVGDRLMNDVLGPASVGMRGLFLDRDCSSSYIVKIDCLSQIYSNL